MSCSRTSRSDNNETRTGGLSVSSQALYHSATALPKKWISRAWSYLVKEFRLYHKKTQAVKAEPRPETHMISKPLHKLTEKGQYFFHKSLWYVVWNTEKQAQILTNPELVKSLVLHTDASTQAISIVLSQIIVGLERVKGYASIVLTKPERRYCLGSAVAQW